MSKSPTPRLAALRAAVRRSERKTPVPPASVPKAAASPSDASEPAHISPPASDAALPPEAHEFYTLIVRGVSVSEACRQLDIDTSVALSWVRSSAWVELKRTTTPQAGADYAMERAAQLLPDAFDTKSRILTGGDETSLALKNRAADSIIGMFGAGFDEHAEREIHYPDKIEIRLIIDTLAEMSGEEIIDITPEDTQS